MKCVETPLREIFTFSNGINFNKSAYSPGVKLIGVSNFGNRFSPDYEELQEINRKFVRIGDYLRNGDIIFVRSNGNKELVGRCMLIKDILQPVTFSGFCIRARIKNTREHDPTFFTYYFKSAAFRKAISGNAVGANIQNLSQERLSNYIACVPDIVSQRKIANILSTYDILIENNQKQIKLLEEAAQRLYKEWFVDLRFPGHENTKITDGVPEGWSVQSINDIAEYINGYAFKPSDWGNLGKPIIKIKEMGSGIASDTPRNTGESIPERYNVTAGDILFSWSATLSAKIWDEEDGLLNQHLFKVIPHGGVSREFVLQSILKTLDEFSNLTTGSTMKHIQRGKLKEVHIIVPNEQMMHIYESISEPSREQILKLKKRIVILQEARDRLLPKLMSGEIEV